MTDPRAEDIAVTFCDNEEQGEVEACTERIEALCWARAREAREELLRELIAGLVTKLEEPVLEALDE